MTDILEKLSHFSLERSGELRPNPDAVMADEAKAEIERLTAQVTGRSGYVFVSTMQEMSDSLTVLRAENERLERLVAYLQEELDTAKTTSPLWPKELC